MNPVFSLSLENDLDASADDRQIEIAQSKLWELLKQLEREHETRQKLESENRSLAEQIARQKIRLAELEEDRTPSVESLTWEERKALILRQLERESADDPATGQHIDVMAETERVVAERDAEIAELRSLLNERSQTSVMDPAATSRGAVGIAGVFDADELIQQERQRLSSLKELWVERMREMEVELSIARAKLARRTP